MSTKVFSFSPSRRVSVDGQLMHASQQHENSGKPNRHQSCPHGPCSSVRLLRFIPPVLLDPLSIGRPSLTRSHQPPVSPSVVRLPFTRPPGLLAWPVDSCPSAQPTELGLAP